MPGIINHLYIDITLANAIEACYVDDIVYEV